ncbi:MAG: hypothetical protein OEZ01_06235 [Candidatus Heimdallarchaeota archaeon]|nr:hypothetical protein [Candidatus Heimdallarchaeota archaeon]MDH5645586.1 hypothetical protein [Candidatus Heimdallarchaeota archaeon]
MSVIGKKEEFHTNQSIREYVNDVIERPILFMISNREGINLYTHYFDKTTKNALDSQLVNAIIISLTNFCSDAFRYVSHRSINAISYNDQYILYSELENGNIIIWVLITQQDIKTHMLKLRKLIKKDCIQNVSLDKLEDQILQELNEILG